MNRLGFWLRGYLRLRLTGASVSWYLNAATAAGLPFWNVKLCDEFTLELCVQLKMKRKAREIADQTMCQVEVLEEGGAPRHLHKLLGRSGLVVAIAIAALVSTELSSRVWFFRVEGNESISSEQILRAVQSCGVTYGTRGTDIHPQDIKNRVLEEIGELAWLTVTHNGVDATITVREREVKPEIQNRKSYCNLVAARDGIVSSVTVLEGVAVVQVGQKVSEGDILISGEIPLEQTVRICGAAGEAYAQTSRRSVVITPKIYGGKTYTGKVKHRVSLLIGKKRIKIFEDGGIFGAKCDKMTTVQPLMLPEGRTLPISIEMERFVLYDLRDTALAATDAEATIFAAARETAERNMTNGTLLRQECELSERAGVYSGCVLLEANEMIAVRSSIRMITGDTNDGARNQRGTNGATD